MRLRMSEGPVKEIQTLFVNFFVSEHFLYNSAHIASHPVNEDHPWWLEFQTEKSVRALAALDLAYLIPTFSAFWSAITIIVRRRSLPSIISSGLIFLIIDYCLRYVGVKVIARESGYWEEDEQFEGLALRDCHYGHFDAVKAWRGKLAQFGEHERLLQSLRLDQRHLL